MSAWMELRADTYRQYGRSSALLTLQTAIRSRTFRVVATARLCQAARNSKGAGKLLLPACKLLHRCAASMAGVDFPWQTKIGAGFALTHGWGMVMSPDAVIGRNVTLFHGVTLGRRDRISADGQRMTGYPTLEDEVWVGPHAIITGGITIGRGSRIAGGAVVSENIPPYSIVAGNPGKIIKSDCIPDVMHPAPLDE
ncbi:serine acetyltransferase [Janthinobacterium sp. LB3P118]|uniref:serine acetyltransferase n=1 Tax=Janthinobacterium sp. LB3P118 TaxID=3424195 RepID=UPI003F525E00